jgi:dihydroorotase
MKLLIKGGRILDPTQRIDEISDILIENGNIALIGKDPAGSSEDLQILEVQGLLIVPGLIDMHTHLREPGFEYKETVRSGSLAAVAGGFTSIACMPNTDPVNDNRSTTEFILHQAALAGFARVFPVACISKGSEGKVLAEFGDLKDAGAVAFSDDGKPVENSRLMRSALEYAASFQMPVISHCEDISLSKDGAMNESVISTQLGLRGIPNIAEDIMVARDIEIAGYTGTSVHIAHVSTAGSVRLIREAKERGICVTAETAPHYFTLTDESLREYDTNFKMNPPLRTVADVTAIREGLRDGTIDAIASDHAPQSSIEKDVEFEYAANGIVGLETSLALSLKLVEEGILSLEQLILKMSANPAGILKIDKGTLKPGSDADITVIDPAKEWTVDIRNFRSQSRNSPYHGWVLKGKAAMTIVGGEIKYRE